jgi:hypothetical protein
LLVFAFHEDMVSPRDLEKQKSEKKNLTQFLPLGFAYQNLRSVPHWTGGVIEGRGCGTVAEGSIKLYDVSEFWESFRSTTNRVCLLASSYWDLHADCTTRSW